MSIVFEVGSLEMDTPSMSACDLFFDTEAVSAGGSVSKKKDLKEDNTILSNPYPMFIVYPWSE